jgi:hypothetical protein
MHATLLPLAIILVLAMKHRIVIVSMQMLHAKSRVHAQKHVTDVFKAVDAMQKARFADIMINVNVGA